MNKQRKYYGTSICQKETPPPILNKKTQVLHHFHLPKTKPHTHSSIKDTSIIPLQFAKKKPHTQSSIKDTSITPFPFAKNKPHTHSSIKRHKYYTDSICQKKTPHPILNKKTQVLRQFHLPKKISHPILNKKTRVLCHFHLPKELHPNCQYSIMFNHLVADLKSSSLISPKSSIHNKHSEHSKHNEILYCFALLGGEGRKEGRKEWKIDDGAICRSFPLGLPLSRVNSRYPTNALKKP
jgi:hypothetical protein